MKRPEGFDSRPQEPAPADRGRPAARSGRARAAGAAEDRAGARSGRASREAATTSTPPRATIPASASPSRIPSRSGTAVQDRPEEVRGRLAEVADEAARAEREARRRARQAERERRRREQLEVRRFTRRARHRRAVWVTAGAVAVVFVGAMTLAAFSPLFALRTIEVVGTERIDKQQVHAALEDELGTPLVQLDQGRIRRELAAFPLIRSFVVEEVPPDRLVVRVVERQPLAVVQAGDGFDLVDAAGVVVQHSDDRPQGYPLISGEPSPTTAAFRSMAEVLLALPSDVAGKVDSITARTHDDVTLTLAGTGQRVLWGSSERSSLKALVLSDLLAQYGDAGPGEYDVSAEGSAVFHHD